MKRFVSVLVGAFSVIVAACVASQSGDGQTGTVQQYTFTTLSGSDLDLKTDDSGQHLLMGNWGGVLPANANNLWIGGGGQSFTDRAVTSYGSGYGGNTAVGINAMNAALKVFGNTAIGYNALAGEGSGITTTAIGYNALGNATFSVDNTVIGYRTGESCTTCQTNTSVGVESLSSCSDCYNNAVYGMSAGQQLTHGFSNACVGPSSGCSTTGSYNASLGYGACAAVTSGIGNVCLGPFTMNNGAGVTGNDNVAIGSTALQNVTSGSTNFAIGPFALASLQTSSNSIGIGIDAMEFIDGANNVAIGGYAMSASCGGSNPCTAVDNVAIGLYAGSTITSGYYNTVIGYSNGSGPGVTTGTGNTIIGSNIAGLAGALTNNVVIADGAGHVRVQADSSGNVSFNGGSNVLYRCTTAGALPVGALTVVSGNCGASVDTGLRTN